MELEKSQTKRRRVRVSLEAAIPDISTWDPELPVVGAEASVRCLSQTVRNVNDDQVIGRDAILIENGSENLDWEQASFDRTSYSYHAERMAVLLYVEAFKSLEPLFTKTMKTLLRMSDYEEGVDLLQMECDVTCSRLGFPLKDENWPEYVTFGAFCACLERLSRAAPHTDAAKSYVDLLVEKGREMFEAIFSEGILELEQMSSGIFQHQEIKDALSFAKEKANYPELLKQMAGLVRDRVYRNQVSHPFSAIGGLQIGPIVGIYERLLWAKMEEGGNQVGLLALLKLRCDEEESILHEKKEQQAQIDQDNQRFHQDALARAKKKEGTRTQR